MHARTIAVVALATTMFPLPAPAQSSQPAPTPPASQAENDTLKKILQELRGLRQRVDSLETQHDADTARIRELERRLGAQAAQQTPRPAPARGAPGAPTTPAPPAPEPVPPTLPPAPVSSAPVFAPGAASLNLNPGTMLGSGNLLNPDITAIVDMGASLSSDGTDKSLNRFNLREVELGFRAAISPAADAVIITSIEEGIDQSDPNNVTVDHTLDIEEAYINFHTLPGGFNLKAGKFRNDFGRNNRLHTHALPQIDRPFAVQAFLGEEGLLTTGASLSWIVPNPFDAYIEATAEVVNSNGGADSPILGGPNAKNPAVIGHIKYFGDITPTSSLEIGGSYLFGHSSGDVNMTGNLFGLDLTYLWRDPQAADSRSFVAQSELFFSNVDTTDPLNGAGVRNNAFGMYAFAQYQFGRNMYAGVRFDYTEFPTADFTGLNDIRRGVSPYFSWYLSEFLRLRLEYQHEFDSSTGALNTRDNLLFGLTYTIGAHPAHDYTVNR